MQATVQESHQRLQSCLYSCSTTLESGFCPHGCEMAVTPQVIASTFKTGIGVRELLEGSKPILRNQQEASSPWPEFYHRATLR